MEFPLNRDKHHVLQGPLNFTLTACPLTSKLTGVIYMYLLIILRYTHTVYITRFFIYVYLSSIVISIVFSGLYCLDLEENQNMGVGPAYGGVPLEPTCW